MSSGQKHAWRLRGTRGDEITVEPALGGKIASLRGPDGFEWLVQADDDGPSPRGGDFEHAEMRGWDECAPSIDACVLSDGTVVGDHGDVWQQAWQVGADGGMTADLPHAGARLSRLIEPLHDGGFRLRYRVDAGADAAPLLWAAHPQFVVPDEASVEVDPTIAWVDVTTGRAVPVVDSAALLTTRGLPPGASRKMYATPERSVLSATLRLADGRGVRLDWTGARYLGVWLSNAHIARAKTVAVEPCTGWYDDLASAIDAGHVATVSPRQSMDWTLDVRFVGELDVGR